MGPKNLKATNHSHPVVTVCTTRYKLKSAITWSVRFSEYAALISSSSTTRCTLNSYTIVPHNRDTIVLYNRDTIVLYNRDTIVLYNIQSYFITETKL